MYKISQEKLPYKEAEQACQTWQGTLSSIENQGEAYHINQFLTADSYWFGLRKLGAWSWNDGTEINFDREHKGDAKCMEVHKAGGGTVWRDADCEKK